MDWIVCGDDWGVHPSTTQHLVRNLPEGDRVVWIDSIGWRVPRVGIRDAGRIASKLWRSVVPSGDELACGERFRLVRPVVVPLHQVAAVRRLNAARLRDVASRAASALGLERPVLLAANPIVFLYRRSLPEGPSVFMRLDDYSQLPGVDERFMAEAENAAIRGADLVVGTARRLIADISDRVPTLYLPQGVDAAHFRLLPVPVQVPRVLGFFGFLQAWLDYDLIREVSSSCPDWQFEFVGPVGWCPPWLSRLPNVRIRPAVPYRELPTVMAEWSAAWIPFATNRLTESVNPLKLREYLSAGLPTASTPLPEVVAAGSSVRIVVGAADVRHWLETEVPADTNSLRLRRRSGVIEESWVRRSATLCDRIASLQVP